MTITSPSRIVAGLALILMATACPGPTSPASVLPTSSDRELRGVAAEIGCADVVELRSVAGEKINLTGIWRYLDDPYPSWNIRQINNCVFFASIGDEEPPGFYDTTCDGELGRDFVITARCIDFLQRDAAFLPRLNRVFMILRFEDDGTVTLTSCLERNVPATCETSLVPWEADADPSPSGS